MTNEVHFVAAGQPTPARACYGPVMPLYNYKCPSFPRVTLPLKTLMSHVTSINVFLMTYRSQQHMLPVREIVANNKMSPKNVSMSPYRKQTPPGRHVGNRLSLIVYAL